jgi:hypothetical protein
MQGKKVVSRSRLLDVSAIVEGDQAASRQESTAGRQGGHDNESCQCDEDVDDPAQDNAADRPRRCRLSL